MKVLYIVLVLCTIAVVGTAIALYLRVRAHLGKGAEPREQQDEKSESTKS
jgi:hypothetical protein